MNLKSIVGCLLLVAACASVAISADEFDPQPIIEGRQSALREVGTAFKGVSDELRKSKPTLLLIREYARQIDDLSKQQKFWFPAGTGPETEIEMRAKADIWTKPAQFKAGQEAMSEQAAKLVETAGSDEIAAIRTQWRALGKTCKDCHDAFREEDD